MTIVGFTEGSGHVNWRVVATHVMWWFMGFFAVLLATYALVAQGQARTLSQHLLTQAGLFPSHLPPTPPCPSGPLQSSCCMACCCCLCHVSQHNQAFSLTNMRLPFVKSCHCSVMGLTRKCSFGGLHTLLKLPRYLVPHDCLSVGSDWMPCCSVLCAFCYVCAILYRYVCPIP